MNLVYGFLCRHRIGIDDELTLQKRLPTDSLDKIVDPRDLIYPWDERKVYFDNYRKVSVGTGYAVFTSVILSLRFAYDKWFHLDLKHEWTSAIYTVRSSISRFVRNILERLGRSA